MWKLTGLFSLIIALVFAQQIKKEFNIEVELTGRVYEEKPRLMPPERLALSTVRELDLTASLLEPPRAMEFAQIKPIEKTGGISCGKPKDALSYQLGIDYYLKGRYDLAEEELSKVVAFPSSAFKPMAEYVLGIIAHSKGQRQKALELFRSSCRFSHMYQKPACEAYYALHFILHGTVPENRDGLWQAVKSIKEGKVEKPDCRGAVFSQYCQYVSDFVEGRENPLYRDSTLVRSALLKYSAGKNQEARNLLTPYSSPGRPYREVALYYLALIEYKEGNLQQAFRYVSVLESINPDLASNLYALLSEKDIYISRLTYSLTKNPRFLENAGILAYNSGDYPLALNHFLEAGNLKYAVYSALRMGDYQRVIDLLEKKKDKDREDYMWLLEALYWTGKDMSGVLSQIASLYPDLAKEYTGWDRFRKGDWLGALGHLEDPYYRAVALYNLKRYREVISILQGRNDQRSNLLKARSALMLGEPALARSFLTDRSDEELYLIGVSYFLEGNYQRAISFFQRVSERSGLRARALLKAGDAYYNLGNREKAKESYYEVLRRFPDSQEARQATLALLEFSGNELSDAELEKLIENFLAKEKNPPPEIIYQYANLLARKGNKERAERELLKLLDTPLKFKAILKLAELEEELSKKLVLYYKVYKEAQLEEDRKKAREELIKIYSSAGDNRSVADLLAEGSPEDRVKAISIYLSLKDQRSALSVARGLIREGYRSREFERYLLDLYRQTGDTALLDYVSKSPDRSIRGEAVLLMGYDSLRRGNKKKALEHFVDISLNYRGEPYYNRAVLEGARILLEAGARRDASCMLERFDSANAKPEELNQYNRLRQGLPKCEVR